MDTDVLFGLATLVVVMVVTIHSPSSPDTTTTGVSCTLLYMARYVISPRVCRVATPLVVMSYSVLFDAMVWRSVLT